MFVSGRRLLVAVLAIVSASCSDRPHEMITTPSPSPGSQRAWSVTVAATPNRLTTSRSAQVSAVVRDAAGEPLRNVAVRFEVAAPAGPGDRFDSSGNPVFTDQNGRAEEVLRTGAPTDAEPYPVTLLVRIAAPGGDVESSIRLVIN